MSAKLSAADRKAVTMSGYKDRHQAFMGMIARQRELENSETQNVHSVMYNQRGVSSPSPSRRGKVPQDFCLNNDISSKYKN